MRSPDTVVDTTYIAPELRWRDLEEETLQMLVLASPGPSGSMDDNPRTGLLYASVAEVAGSEALQVKNFSRAAFPDLRRPHDVCR